MKEVGLPLTSDDESDSDSDIGDYETRTRDQDDSDSDRDEEDRRKSQDSDRDTSTDSDDDKEKDENDNDKDNDNDSKESDKDRDEDRDKEEVSDRDTDSEDETEENSSQVKRKRAPKKKKQTYKEMLAAAEDMREKYRGAIDDYNNGKYSSIKKAADAYGLPKSSLHHYLTTGKEYQIGGKKLSILTAEEELQIYEVIVGSLEVGRGLTLTCLKILIQRQLQVLTAANPHRLDKYLTSVSTC